MGGRIGVGEAAGGAGAAAVSAAMTAMTALAQPLGRVAEAAARYAGSLVTSYPMPAGAVAVTSLTMFSVYVIAPMERGR